MTMARGSKPESKANLRPDAAKKQGRAVRGVTIRFPDAVSEVRFNKFVEEFKGTQPEALGFIISEYLKDTY